MLQTDPDHITGGGAAHSVHRSRQNQQKAPKCWWWKHDAPLVVRLAARQNQLKVATLYEHVLEFNKTKAAFVIDKIAFPVRGTHI